MDLNLREKHALVCGSTQGIGRAVAMELAALGANVTLLARNATKLEAVKVALPNDGSQTHSFFTADFARPSELRESLAAWKADAAPVHILINNTGGPPGGPAHRADVEEFRTAFNQHLVCNHTLVQALLDDMKTAGYGRVINVISTSVKQPLDNLGVSNTIRGAVANWAKTLANELGPHGITVNNVLPGATATERLFSIIRNKAAKAGSTEAEAGDKMKKAIPAGRFAQPEEVAAAIAFLASPAAAYINGINLPVDGGRTRSL
ncbi:MAG: SDR family oxidoreductase [Bacteroidota bacterium]